MNKDKFYKSYFGENTRGYNIMRRFYNRYADLLSASEYPDFDDFRNQIYVNLSNLDLSRAIKSKEGYCIGAIKIQCRVQLEKALKEKVMYSESQIKQVHEENSSLLDQQSDSQTNLPEEQFNEAVLLREIALFRLQLRPVEKEVLNSLIDGVERAEIAQKLVLNENTLDTHIRRIRLRLIDYLEKRGYKTELLARIKRP